MFDNKAQSRKWLLTINNPLDHGMTHDEIIDRAQKFNPDYVCLADEIGASGTLHTHVYLYSSSPMRFGTVKKRFPTAHIDKANGTAEDNRAYIRKEGKWADTRKSETSVEGTFKEFGELPDEASEKSPKYAKLLQCVKNGMSNQEILAIDPSFAFHLEHIDKLRQDIRFEKYLTENRFIKVRYLYGDSGTGKTQKEVSQKMKSALAALDSGTYIAPCKMTVAEWLDVWASQYLGGVKESTVAAYNATIRTHIKPGLGAIRLDALDTHLVQSFYNGLREPTKERAAVSPKTVKNVHGILHKALQQAVANGYIRFNPTNSCILPRIEKKELQPLDEAETKLFLDAVKGHPLELLYTITLFTGLREGEALGLTWDRVDFMRGTILISKQLQKEKKAGGQFRLVSLKNDKPRRIQPAPWVMQLLRDRKLQQYEHKEKAGAAWSNPLNLVFTNELGGNLIPQTVVRHFKEIVTSIGRPDARFHDLRHSYAVASLRSGDDIKTVQGNLGHATAAFTLDVYGHVTNQMQEASAVRMEAYIKGILEL